MTVCPIHECNLLLIPAPSGRGHEWRCPVIGCATQEPGYVPTMTAAKLPGLDGGKQARAVRWKESDTERAVDEGAGYKRWENLSTVARYKLRVITCPACRHEWEYRPTGGTGTTPGVPDRLIAPDWLPPYLFIAMELKGSHTPFTSSVDDEAQKRMAASRRIFVGRTWTDVELATEYVREMLKIRLR